MIIIGLLLLNCYDYCFVYKNVYSVGYIIYKKWKFIDFLW